MKLKTSKGIYVFIVKYNYRKLQMRIGECCISKLEKVAKHSTKLSGTVQRLSGSHQV